MLMAAKYVFLSYCHENKLEVSQLRDDLINAGETVWWDEDILTGEELEYTISQAMRQSYAFVLCLSEKCEQRIASGIYPEIRDAIATYRNYKPGSAVIFPVRLSDCDVPPLRIDSTTTLDKLKYVDLFPPAKRAEGLSKLIQALQRAPHHP